MSPPRIEETTGTLTSLAARERDVTVRKHVFAVDHLNHWEPPENVTQVISVLNQPTHEAEKEREEVVGRLQSRRGKVSTLFQETSVATYFILNSADPDNQQVTIAWELAPGYLKKAVDKDMLTQQGMTVIAGRLLKTAPGVILAQLDGLKGNNDTSVPKDTEFGQMINSLHAQNILPVSDEGFVQLPSFVQRWR